MAARGSGSPKDPKGLYATLGVSVTADAGEIRKAYRRLALQWHPDKNPDNQEATAEFQKISAAYEVLSEPERRELYDTRGVIDADELDEDLDHANDLFAAFFGGGGGGELDPEEQALLDEFLRFAGASAFKPKGRKGKKGRGGARAKARQSAEEQMMGELFMSAMAGGMGAMPDIEPKCPEGHPLKRKKADGDYECDVCSKDILEGKRIFDCRKCDFSMCLKCHKAAEEAADEAGLAEGMELDPVELLEAFCTPVRQGRRLQFRCELCGGLLGTQEEALSHLSEEHEDQIREAINESVMGGMPGMSGPPGGMAGLESIFMMEEMLGGGLGGMSSGSMPKAPRRSRKKRC